MKIKINGVDKTYLSKQNLKQTINEFCKNSNRVIAEVNGEIVRAEQWDETLLKNGDNIELVSFVGGG